jgi:WD40 repeat protein
LAWAPREEAVIAAGLDHRLLQWDAATGAVRKNVELAEPIVALTVTPDGRAFAGAAASGTVSLWDIGAETARQTLPAENVSSVAWSPDGRQLLAASGADRLLAWRAVFDPTPLATLTSDGGNRVAVAFSPDGRWFASGGDDRVVTIRDVATGEVVKVLQGHRSVVYNCEFSSDGRWLATGGFEGTVRIWDTTVWQMRQALPHRGSIRAIGFSQDGTWIASGTSERAACIWEVETGRKLLELPDQPAWVTGVAFAPDRQTLYTATGSWSAAYASVGAAVASWKLESSDEGINATSLRQSTKRTGSLECLRISADGQRLVTSGTDSQIVVWDPKMLTPLQSLGHDRPLHRGTLLPGDKHFAAGDVAGRVGVWDLASKQRLQLFYSHAGHTFDVAASADGEVLASASEDDTIQFWSATGRSRPTSAWAPFMDQILNSRAKSRP